MEDFKQKYEEVKDKTLEYAKTHPFETLVIVSMAFTATAKLINSATQARNAKTWAREVRRRESMRHYR